MGFPTSSQNQRLVGLLAKYINSEGSPIRVQQKRYNAYLEYFERLERIYPNIDFRSEGVMRAYVEKAQVEARQKLFRGPGASF